MRQAFDISNRGYIVIGESTLTLCSSIVKVNAKFLQLLSNVTTGNIQ